MVHLNPPSHPSPHINAVRGLYSDTLQKQKAAPDDYKLNNPKTGDISWDKADSRDVVETADSALFPRGDDQGYYLKDGVGRAGMSGLRLASRAFLVGSESVHTTCKLLSRVRWKRNHTLYTYIHVSCTFASGVADPASILLHGIQMTRADDEAVHRGDMS